MTQAADKSTGKFGTFAGVFTPSILTILGVIMYLRMGWVVANVGLLGTIVIVTISSSITFLTGLSIAATATNMRVGGGGAYYMISRSFGVEAGAAIGVPLFLAQALGISFYIAGFSESLCALLPAIDPRIVGTLSLLALFGLAYVSADLALKAQFVIFAIILLSLISFFLGSSLDGESAVAASSRVADAGRDTASFWTVFAVFFPAVTGILTGVSMSGDLKNPSRSLPVGTIGAVLVGYAIYLAIPYFLWLRVSPDVLATDNMIMQKVARVPQLIILGVWGATLSSALGALLSAPRTLQALARDRVLPQALGRGAGPDGNPRVATVVTLVVALGGILLGDLNAIAPILSMFFLTSYGMLNLSAGVEQIIGNPSWRPKFRVPGFLSMAGAFGCLAAMFLINPMATFIAVFLVGLLYYFLQRRQLKTHWGDIRRGIFMTLARYSIYRLSRFPPNAKSWRPNLLVFTGSPMNRWHLIEFANAVTHGKGFLTISTILAGPEGNHKKLASLRKTVQAYLEKRNVEALVHIKTAESVMGGAVALVKGYGVGPLVPNTVVLGETEDEGQFESFCNLMMQCYFSQRNVVIYRRPSQGRRENPARKNRIIDVWWGRERHNAGLMLAIAYMIQVSPEWGGAQLRLRSFVKADSEREAAVAALNTFVAKGRLEVEVDVQILSDWSEVFDRIRMASQNTDLVFLGMRPPDEQETVENYAQYYARILELTNDFPALAITVAAEDVPFAEIFD